MPKTWVKIHRVDGSVTLVISDNDIGFECTYDSFADVAKANQAIKHWKGAKEEDRYPQQPPPGGTTEVD